MTGYGPVADTDADADAGDPDPATPCTATHEVDEGADGSFEYVIIDSYNADGLVTETTSDGGFGLVPDGGVDARYRNFYDADGRLVRYEQDHNADGTVDGFMSWTYDADGRLTRYEDDHYGDGTFVDATTYTYDGELLSEVAWGPEGSAARAVERYEYDADGHIARMRIDATDGGRDDRVHTYEVDASGYITAETYLEYLYEPAYDEMWVSSRVDWESTYDADGNRLTLLETLSTCTGGNRPTETPTYRGDREAYFQAVWGPYHTKLSDLYDYGNDGTYELRMYSTYDASYRELTYDVDYDADGVSEWRRDTTYSC